MSAYLYEEVLIQSLRDVIGDSRIQIMPVDRVYDIIPRLNDDKIILPLVTISRTSWSVNASEANHTAKYEGATASVRPYDKQFNSTRIQKTQFVPMRLDWSIDVWTRTRQENDEFIRELFWYFMTAPTYQVKVPYNLEFDHNFNIFISDDIIDNSDVAQHQLKGEMFRQTLNIYTDDAKLWKSSSRGPTTVEVHHTIHTQTLEEAARDMTSASTSSDIQ